MGERFAVGKHESRALGFEHERDILGDFPIKNPDYINELKRLSGKEAKADIPYLKYRESLELVKKHQPWDPTNPRNEFLRELRLELYDRFNIDPHDQPDAIKTYTAIGTPLDRYHGVDGFITLDKDKRELIATLDASLRTEKIEEGYKADVIIGDVPSYLREKEFMQAVEKNAAAIAAVLKEKGRQTSFQGGSRSAA